MAREKQKIGWYKLPRSGARMYGPIPAGATEADPPAPPTEGELAELTADTVVKVRRAVDRGQLKESDRLLIHAVHTGVTPTNLLTAFGVFDPPVQTGERSSPVSSDVEGDLPSEPAQVTDTEPVGGEVAAESESGETGQASKPKRARAKKDSAEG